MSKLTDEQIASIPGLREQGLTFQAISDRYGCTRQAIAWHCSGKGPLPRQPRLEKPRTECVNGHSWAENKIRTGNQYRCRTCLKATKQRYRDRRIPKSKRHRAMELLEISYLDALISCAGPMAERLQEAITLLGGGNV